MHSKLMSVVAGAGMMMAAALSVSAHHSFSAEFDSTKPVTLEGKVVMMEWVNPHSWLHIDVTKADGKVERWEHYGPDQKLEKIGFSRANDGVEDAWSFPGPDGSTIRIEVSTHRDGKVTRKRDFKTRPEALEAAGLRE